MIFNASEVRLMLTNHLSDSSLLDILCIVKFVTLFCFRQCIAIACVNSFSSLYAGVVVFSTLGFMAKQQGVSVGEVAESGKKTGCFLTLNKKESLVAFYISACLFMSCKQLC